jgi:hypothetical protein
MILNAMRFAPRDGTHILVYASWKWSINPPKKKEWRVAHFTENFDYIEGEDDPSEELQLIAVSSNPYVDVAIDPLFWVELPEVNL